ncbi:hypothetical protein D9M71_171140 [compost metagenome]
MLCTRVMTQCSTAISPLSRPSRKQASRTSCGSTSARLACRQWEKRCSSLSSAASDNQATSKFSAISSRRQASNVLVLPQPAGPWITTQRCRRASCRRSINPSRTIRRRAPRGGTTLVSAMAWSPSDDGARLVPVSGGSGISDTSRMRAKRQSARDNSIPGRLEHCRTV